MLIDLVWGEVKLVENISSHWQSGIYAKFIMVFVFNSDRDAELLSRCRCSGG